MTSNQRTLVVYVGVIALVLGGSAAEAGAHALAALFTLAGAGMAAVALSREGQ